MPVIERNPTPMILVIVCTAAALVFGLYSFSKNNESAEVPERAAAINGQPGVEPASGSLHPSADPTQ